MVKRITRKTFCKSIDPDMTFCIVKNIYLQTEDTKTFVNPTRKT